MADIQERKFWDQYMEVYGECLSATSTKEAPWYVVPADDKKNARLFVSQIILDAIDGLKLAYPRVTRDQKRKLALIRKHLKK